MSTGDNHITLMLVFESGRPPVSIKLARWKYQLAIGLLAVLVLVSIFGTLNFARLSLQANERDFLLQENEELRRLNSKVVVLESNLQAYREMLHQVATLAGVDLTQYGMSAVGDSAATLSDTEFNIDAGAPVSGALQPAPTGLPVRGYLSRTFRPLDENPKTRHLGVDIAVKKGTRVTATADGEVAFAGWDDTFGWMVVLKHANNVETMYGHNDTLLVATGAPVSFGQTLALSGNTGVSTAPHVHYEVRIDGKPVDPEKYYGKTTN